MDATNSLFDTIANTIDATTADLRTSVSQSTCASDVPSIAAVHKIGKGPRPRRPYQLYSSKGANTITKSMKVRNFYFFVIRWGWHRVRNSGNAFGVTTLCALQCLNYTALRRKLYVNSLNEARKRFTYFAKGKQILLIASVLHLGCSQDLFVFSKKSRRKQTFPIMNAFFKQPVAGCQKLFTYFLYFCKHPILGYWKLLRK